MIDNKTVMQRALDALIEYDYAKTDKADGLGFEAICALREAIAQPVQEPLSDVSILNICSCSELMQLRKAANFDQLLICFARTILAAQQESKA